MTHKGAYITGSIFCALGVLLGAFGAHALEGLIGPDRLHTWETAVRYQFFHGLGLLVLGMLMERRPAGKISRSAAMMTAGVGIFSGSLYLLVLTDISFLGAVAPVGGLLMAGAWLIVPFALLSRKQEANGK